MGTINSVINYSPPPPLNNTSNDLDSNQKNNKKFRSLPFVGGSSHIICKMIGNLNDGTSTAFRKFNTIGNLFFSKIKDTIPKEKFSGLVYKIPCENCPKVYIGETMPFLSKRIHQHNYGIRKSHDDSALTVHAKETGHNFDFSNTSILAFENNNQKRKTREVVEILKHKEAMNFKTDTDKLSSFHSSILKM